MLMIQPWDNWPTDVGAFWLRDYMVRADNLLYVSLAQRCHKHIIRRRKYAAPEKGNVQVRLPVTLSKPHIVPLNYDFRGVGFCVFFSLSFRTKS